jgi:site-specific recombinase XerD
MPHVLVPLSVKQKLDQLKTFMEKHEYHESTILSYQTYVSRFLRSSYFDEKKPDLKDQINAFLKNQIINSPKTFKYNRAAQYTFYEMEKEIPYLTKSVQIKNEEIENLLFGFRNHLHYIKHLTISTTTSESNYIRRFLESVQKKYPGKLYVSQLDAYDIRQYFVDEINYLKPSSKGRIATAIRNFFRYLKYSRENVNESVFKLPLSPAVWKLSSVPTVLNDIEFNSLLNSFNKNTATGVRDYAITTCFTELGLRCMEVSNLSIDDFNWYEGEVSIKNTKTHTDRKLPISATVGKAIVDYLKFSRPKANNRILFVRFSHAKGEPMGNQQIRGVIRRAYSRAGISKKITGTHILRRTFASRIYGKGNSLKMVADILGHESLDSTVIYTKINKEQLFHAAGVWPGGDSYDK